VYVTQLRCGHRFHDECILPKLNEALECPTCGTRDDEP
jgi:DNA-directed RNA polymerase subunit RPC12/RpoP